MPQLIASRYELVELLGRGGMGAVWLARDHMLGREVAVKEVLLPRGLEGGQVERILARTLREARSAARLDHPGIVTVHDVVEEDRRPWIVMRLVRAPALDRVVADRGPLPPAQVARIGLDLLEALCAAHAAGVVHRDVKPGNVLLTADRAVLTDFGIATMAGDETLTQTGAIIGSPAYLAPEQARHQKATPSSDLWSLGATLYAAVENRPPYQRGDVWGVMSALLADEPDAFRLAGPLAPALQGLLRKDPAERLRPEDAERLLREAERAGVPQPAAVDGGPPPGDHPGYRDATLPPPAPSRTDEMAQRPPRVRRWKVIVPAGALALALVAGVAAVLVLTDGPGRPDPGRTSAAPTGGGTPGTGRPTTGTGGAASVPAGYQEYRGAAFVAAIPQGWKAEPEGRDVLIRDPDGSANRGIAVQRIADVTGGEAKWLADAAGKFKNDPDYPDFKQVAFRENLPYLGGQAAELEFTFTKNGKAGRVRTRLFSFNGGLYQALMISRQDNWDATTPYFDTFLNTFRAP